MDAGGSRAVWVAVEIPTAVGWVLVDFARAEELFEWKITFTCGAVETVSIFSSETELARHQEGSSGRGSCEQSGPSVVILQAFIVEEPVSASKWTERSVGCS